MNNLTFITNKEFLRLLKKYTLIIIFLELFTRFGFTQIFRIYEKLFPFEGSLFYNEFMNAFKAIATVTLNLIIGFILIYDFDRKTTLTWILFGLTILNPWMSIIFLLIWKVTEINNNA